MVPCRRPVLCHKRVGGDAAVANVGSAIQVIDERGPNEGRRGGGPVRRVGGTRLGQLVGTGKHRLGRVKASLRGGAVEITLCVRVNVGGEVMISAGGGNDAGCRGRWSENFG